ncbi:hypothetical protein ABW21_db0204254 [Orbilia brochopaga]|nr:hypothetical protein ABW21_db0204254 [Drechslerella brochopaga]
MGGHRIELQNANPKKFGDAISTTYPPLNPPLLFFTVTVLVGGAVTVSASRFGDTENILLEAVEEACASTGRKAVRDSIVIGSKYRAQGRYFSKL